MKCGLANFVLQFLKYEGEGSDILWSRMTAGTNMSCTSATSLSKTSSSRARQWLRACATSLPVKPGGIGCNSPCSWIIALICFLDLFPLQKCHLVSILVKIVTKRRQRTVKWCSYQSLSILWETVEPKTCYGKCDGEILEAQGNHPVITLQAWETTRLWKGSLQVRVSCLQQVGMRNFQAQPHITRM